MSEPDPFIIQTLERVLQAEWKVSAAGDEQQISNLWNTLQETGLPHAWVKEALGGGGFALADGFGIARAAARHAAPVPLAETLLAGWVLAEAGIAMPAGAMSIVLDGAHGRVDAHDDGSVSGRFGQVAHARHADHLVVVAGEGEGASVSLVAMRLAQIEEGARGTTVFDRVEMVREASARRALMPKVTVDHVTRLGAVVRALQIAGTLEHLLERTVTYANERKQFGRAIAKFQAVQHALAQLAGETAAAVAASAAAASAVERYGLGDERTLLAVASAKIRCGQAASEGAAIAHQVHGAMGFAAEYPLHLFTKSLWFWRDDFGAETEWAERLGSLVAARGADDYWATLTAV